MAYDDIIERKRGFVEFGLLISGLPYIFHSGGTWANPTTISGIEGDLTPKGFLSEECVDGIEEVLELDPKEWDLKAQNMEFELVDARASDGTQHALTPIFGRKIGGVTSTRLAETLSATGTVIKVDDASDFTAPFDAYRGQETIGVDTIDLGATPDELQDLTRGKYGSVAQEHVYSLDPDGVRPEGDIRPLVTDGPISLHGRFVFLYAREARPDGTFDSVAGLPTLRYIGRIMGNVECDGPVWRIPTESVWTSIDSKLPAGEHGSEMQEIVFQEDLVVEWETVNGALGDTVTITDRRFPNGASLVTRVVAELNASIIAAGDDVRLRAVPFLGGGPGMWAWSFTDDGGDATERIILTFHTDVLADALGFTLDVGGRRPGPVRKFDIFPVDAAGEVGATRTVAADAGIFYFGPDPIPDVGVVDASVFSAFSLVKEAEDEGDSSYDIRSFVTIGSWAYYLLSVDTGANTITVRRRADFAGGAVTDDTRNIQYMGEAPLEVREFISMEGTWWAAWQALLESTTVSREFKGYVRSDVIDWDGLSLADAHAPYLPMERTIIEPTSFLEMLIEDLSIRGLFPTVRNGLISAFPLSAPGELSATFTVDQDIVLEEVLLKSTYSRERILNGLIYKWCWDWFQQEFARPTVRQRDADSQQDNDISQYRTIEHKGLNWRDVAKADVFAMGKLFLKLFGQDYAVIEVPVTIGAAGVVPGDVITLTDESPPDPEAGTRGVSQLLCLVLGSRHKIYSAKGVLTVLVVSDGRRRSGWAPAARIATYVDNGAPAGTSRYELTLTTGLYAPATEAANTEGSYFNAGAKVELRERDAASATVESNTISAAAHNAAGTSVYLTAAPSGGMQVIIAAGHAYITYDDYTTASQIPEALHYLHTCDEDDGLILDTDEGFHPA